MTKFIEIIKQNKLRAILVGISVFLFGFISVSVFNNIGDTHAYIIPNCPSGWSDAGDTNGCCPENSKYDKDEKICIIESMLDSESCSSLGGNFVNSGNTQYCNINVQYFYGTILDANGGILYNVYNSDNGEKIITCRSSDSSSCKLEEKYQAYGIKEIDKYSFVGFSSSEDCNSLYIKGQIKEIKKDTPEKLYACYKSCYKCERKFEDGTEGARYEVAETAPEGECKLQKNYDEEGCLAENKNDVSVTFWYGENNKEIKSCTTTYQTPKSCEAEIPKVDGIKGWALSPDDCAAGNYIYDNDSTRLFYNDNKKTLYACYEKKETNTEPEPENPPKDEEPSVEEEKKYTVTFDPNGGTWANGSEDPITEKNLTGIKTFVTLEKTGDFIKKQDHYLSGWMVGSTSTDKKYYRQVDETDDGITLYANWVPNTPSGSDYNDVPIDSNNGSSGGNTTTEKTAFTRKFYTIKYDLDGGMFLDGSTKTRTTIIPSNVVIGEFKLYPVKKNKKFKEWQLDGKKFNFDQKPTKNITLKAVYEDLTDEDKSFKCKDKNYIYEPTTKLCYKVLKTDNKNTFDYTLYTYKPKATFCYAASTDKSGGIHFRVDDEYFKMSDHIEIKGKNDTPYEGYDKQESWVSEDTCKIGLECNEIDQSKDVYATECKVQWNAIIYTVTDSEPNDEEPTIPELPEEKEETPSDGNGKDEETGKEPSNDKTDEEAPESPKLGNTMIIIACLVGLSALGYSAYYFIRKNRENKI